jgi:hypothetical protein
VEDVFFMLHPLIFFQLKTTSFFPFFLFLFFVQTEVGLFVKSSIQVAERVFMVSWANTFGNSKLKSARVRQTAAAEGIEYLTTSRCG